jgi:alpha-ribazole phosphatase/probable phosphoglycerate mutase
MLTILFSPHMTSVDNERGRASGHADVPLSAEGRERAKQLGQHYAKETIAKVFCSDMQRAVTTAQIAFAGRAVPMVPDARLREYDYGDLTQHPAAEMEREFLRRISEPFPRGESLVMVVQRVRDFLSEVLRTYDGLTIVIIGHRATRYALEYWCADVSLEDIVRAPWEWREIPIFRYQLSADALSKRA